MAIRKSSELHDWLLGLNFRIFTWQLDIGLWIETAVDWAVSWINQAYNLADTALTWGKAAWDRAGEFYQQSLSYIHTYTRSLFAGFETLGGYLADWWLARKTDVLDWIDARLYDLKSYTESILSLVNNLSSAWERFRSDTLPSLVDLTWFRSWWGQGSTPFESWWSWARGLISDETEAKLDPVRQGVNRNASWLEMIKSFIDDPEDFLYRAVDRIIERFW